MVKSLLHLFLLIIPFGASSQYIFKSITKEDGLSAKEATCVLQDKEGFIWVGTAEGVSRYDGTRIKVFNKAHKTLAGLKDEYIMSLSEWETGKIVIGTRKDLVVYDKRSGTAVPVAFVNEEGDTLRDMMVTKLLSEPGHLWIATVSGLFVYKNGAAVPASRIFANAGILNNRTCMRSACIVDSARKGLWIGTSKGLIFLNYENGQVRSVRNDPSPLFDSSMVAALALDAKGNLWISSSRHFLSYYDVGKQSFTDIKFLDAEKKFPVDRMSSSLFTDRPGRLWVTNDYFKIFVLDKDGNTVILPDQSPEPYKPGYGFFHSAFTDRPGNLWLATLTGVSWLSHADPLQNLFEVPRQSPNENPQPTSINNFKKGPDGLWWLCKYDGLYSMDERSGHIERYNLPSPSVLHNRFFDLAWINNEWWCGTGDGIQIFNPRTKTFRPFDGLVADASFRGVAVTWLFQDSRKNIWFAGWKNAVYRYDLATRVCTRYSGNDSAVNSLCYFVDREKKIWFGFGDKGVRQYDPATGVFSTPDVNQYPPLINTVVYMMSQDSRGFIYAATRDGIIEIDPSGTASIRYTRQHGLARDRVTNIFVDPSDNIWTVNDDDVYYKGKGASSFSSFKIETGMPYIPDDWSQFTTDGRNLYVSLIQKFAVIDFSRVSAPAAPASPLIGTVSVFEKHIPFSSHDPRIDLKADENFVVIEFSPAPGSSTAQTEFAYKLEGYDRDWVYCGSRQNAAYTNLPDGDYTFLVKASTQKDNWNTPVAQMAIHIAPPFYKTIWFLSLVAIAAAMLLYWLYRIYKEGRQRKYISKTIDYFANSVYGENTVNEICWDIARNCISQLKLEDCVVYLLDESRNVLVQKAAYGPKNPREHEIIHQMELPIGKGVVGTAAANARPVLVADTRQDNRYVVDDDTRLSELAVPIIHEGRVIGVIDSEHPRKDFFTADHVKALSTIAAISASKIAEAKAEEAARQSRIELLEIKNMLAESQLMALRAQMNPHFVFNCLNSIQECIVMKKYGEASLYLNKFAKLFRSVLNNSGRVLIPLAEEIEVLELYLSLEHMRFERSFSYDIHLEEDLEADEIMIPSMLLQPYVENALWHGLMHKNDDRRLNISFKKLSEDIFQCVVEDNGIGRERALALKERQTGTRPHVSRGMSISADRMSILTKQGEHAELKIIDKKSATGEASGTKVIVELSSYLKA